MPVRLAIYVGDVDVTPYHLQVRIQNRIGEVPSARLELRTDVGQDVPIDYFADVRIVAKAGDAELPQFVGCVESAGLSGSALVLECAGGAQLRDQSVPPFLRAGLTAAEGVWTIGRSAGLPADRLAIEGIDEPVAELIRIAVPIGGVAVEGPISVGSVVLQPQEAVTWALQGWQREGLAKRFRQYQCFAVVELRERLLLDAERRALSLSEVAAAWIATRLRYGASRLPGGALHPFNRQAARAVPDVGDVIAVRGLQSGRRWLRVPAYLDKRVVARFGQQPTGRWSPSLPESYGSREAEALLCFKHSTDTADPLSSLISLWDAIEFYVGGRRPPLLFAKEQLRELRDLAPSWMSLEQKEAFARQIGHLNSPPLLTRLRFALSEDDVQYTEDEFDLLVRLRKLRNPAQHGVARVRPVEGDLRLARSFVSRMLVHMVTKVASAQGLD